MTDFGEVLTGFVIPELSSYEPDPASPDQLRKVKPLGNNGLNGRIYTVAYLWGILRAVRLSRFWIFGLRNFPELFNTFASTTKTTWLTEFLRIMDRSSTGKGRQSRENLTVALCHERFQSDASLTAQQRTEESRLFTLLDSAYSAADLRDFRNRHMFHIDHVEALTGISQSKDVGPVMDKLFGWYAFVASCHFGDDRMAPWLADAQARGKLAAREFRRMLVTYLRVQVGKPSRRRPVAKWSGKLALRS